MSKRNRRQKEARKKSQRQQQTHIATMFGPNWACEVFCLSLDIAQEKFSTYNYLWFDLISLVAFLMAHLNCRQHRKKTMKKNSQNKWLYFRSVSEKKEMLAFFSMLICLMHRNVVCFSCTKHFYSYRVDLVKSGVDFISLRSIAFLWLIMMPSTWHFSLFVCVFLLLSWIVLNGHQHNLPKWFDTNNHN